MDEDLNVEIFHCPDCGHVLELYRIGRKGSCDYLIIQCGHCAQKLAIPLPSEISFVETTDEYSKKVRDAVKIGIKRFYETLIDIKLDKKEE